MPDEPVVHDAAERARALDPTTSFLVQAPAGSGKTELLIQRYMVLLATVEEPEAVIAITFTRKAAGEMRRRVVNALEEAAGPEPERPYKALTWRLARAVREWGRTRDWKLEDNPSRLQIRTIDSLCASISRRMPWVSRMGARPELVDDARDLYREAARNTIALLDDDRYAPHLSRVLLHLDNDCAALESLLAEMLARRDQWLRHLTLVDPSEARPVLERSLRHVIEDALAAALESAPELLVDELPAIARHAARNVEEEHTIAACINLTGLPGTSIGCLPAWLGIAELLLTGKGDWRKSPDRRVGLPPQSRAEKELLKDMIGALEGNNEFRTRLHTLRRLPPPAFDNAQWAILESLIPVLLAAAGGLRVLFGQRGEADFSEASLASLRALGDEGEPEDLALALDSRIRHLLVDEFQDTSITQFQLIERLTAGWEQGDGRTLFAVGDPMQSIYRFREAEVGLFLKAASEGVGQVRFEVLRLTTNFRSEAGLVEWVNAAFPSIMAEADDIATGAVKFLPSKPVRTGTSRGAVTVHPLLGQGDAAEAEGVVEIVRRARATDSQAKIAILVRGRTHLPQILAELRRAGLRYRAIEIDQLGDLPLTQDLLALTRALLHPADRVAWLAILRAPWCGLTLADLYALVSDAPRTPVWELIRDDSRIARLSDDGQMRLRRIRGVLEDAVARRGRRLRAKVENCWLQLGGPACAADEGQANNALAFFELLERIDEGGDVNFESLVTEVDRLFAAPDPAADDSLEVMTIHKAKGLEFDVVILPGLGRKVSGDSPRLLAWLERPSGQGRSELLLAPMKATGSENDRLYEYLKRVESEKARHETARLLYVAATRARKRLHLFGEALVKIEKGMPVLREPANTLLAHLWPAVQEDFSAAFAAVTPIATTEAVPTPISQTPLRRLRSDWTLPAPPAGVSVSVEMLEEAPATEPAVTFEWVGDTLRHVGTVVHRMLQQIADDGSTAVDARRPAIETALRTLGVPPGEIEQAAATVVRAVTATLDDDRGRWILDGKHKDARSEYAVAGILGGKLVTARVDRTFVDSDGVRWIVDFKTSAHEGGGRESFLDNERERYREQLSLYAQLFAKLENRPVRTALYFPLLGGWRECASAMPGSNETSRTLP